MTVTRAITPSDSNRASITRRALAAIIAVQLTAVACGGGAAVTTPVDPIVAGAAEAAPPTATATTPTATAITSTTSTTTSTTSTTSTTITSTTTSTTAAPTTTSVESTVDPATSIPTGWSAFDARLAQLLAQGSSAVSATVLRDGEVVHEVALGERTTGGDPVEVGDRYRIASISKVITAITTLRLVDQGLIDLDEPIGERLANSLGLESASSGVETITPRHLLTHRSGIAQYENLMFARQVESCPQAGAFALGSRLDRTPGTTFRYSNVNFCLLGQWIEEVTGQSYVDVVTEQLLGPLDISGMRFAGTFDVGASDVEHASQAGRNYMEVLDGAGSWIASPTDVATIIDSLDEATGGWKALSPEMNAEMRTITLDPAPVPLPDAEPSPDAAPTTLPPPLPVSGYGMGLMIFGPESFGHTGTLENTHAMTMRQPGGITWAITVSGIAPSSSRELATIVTEALAAGGVD